MPLREAGEAEPKPDEHAEGGALPSLAEQADQRTRLKAPADERGTAALSCTGGAGASRTHAGRRARRQSRLRRGEPDVRPHHERLATAT
jgi:hypothetical protein